VTQKCKEGQCLGLIENQNCAVHEDCGAGSYCRVNINWPFRSMCSKQKGSFEQCNSDFECANSLYCWFSSPDDRISNAKKCLPMYSQVKGTTFGWRQVSSADSTKILFVDYETNGKYC
jgi:hypothetical protein